MSCNFGERVTAIMRASEDWNGDTLEQIQFAAEECGIDLSADAELSMPELYRAGKWKAPAPPVCTFNWGESEWIAWIDSMGEWES